MLFFRLLVKPKSSKKTLWIEEYSVVKVQIACEPSNESMCTSGSQRCGLGDKRTFQVQTGLGANMHHPAAPLIAQKVVTDAIGFRIHQTGQRIL